MLDLYNIRDLMQHYKIWLGEADENTIDRIEELANNDVEEVVHPTHEYPTFLHYIVLVYIDGIGRMNFHDMSDDDKYRYTRDTIKEIRRIWERPETQRMIKFLKETYSVCMPHRNTWIENGNILCYTFNNIDRKNLSDFETLCDMMEIRYESTEATQYDPYKIKIFF